MKETEFRSKIQELNLKAFKKAQSSSADFTRQLEEDDFKGEYEAATAIKPPYDLSFLWRLYEESDALQLNVQAKIKNIVGMGYTYVYLGEDKKNIPEAHQAEKTMLDNLFDQVNEDDSWLELIIKGREDYEVTGNQAIEVIRNRLDEPNLFYFHPVEKLRMCPLEDKDYIVQNIVLTREGREIETPVERRFRKFIRKNSKGKIRYYKSFGDPRPLTVEGKESAGGKQASELIWFKNNFGAETYGLPEWIGAMFDVAGRRDAQAMNWDLLRSQGISPMAILVEGKITEETWDEIWNMVMGAKGVEQFNKVWVLQVQPVATAIGAKGSANIRIENLTGMQKSDLMFNGYLDKTKDTIRQSFRNPPGFVGEVGAYSYATLDVAKTLGEEQVYGPERILWDKRINRVLLKDTFGIQFWRYKTKAAEVAGATEIRNSIATLTNAGVITINNAIKLANDALGREFSTFDEKWADYPLPLVLRLLDRAQLKGLEPISAPLPAVPQGQEPKALPALPPGMDARSIPALKDDLSQTVESVVILKGVLDKYLGDDDGVIDMLKSKLEEAGIIIH